MNGDDPVAMEVDPTPLTTAALNPPHRTFPQVLPVSSHSAHTSQDRLSNSHSSPQLDNEEMKCLVTFGKDLRRLYDTLTAETPNEKLKVLLQVRLCYC